MRHNRVVELYTVLQKLEFTKLGLQKLRENNHKLKQSFVLHPPMQRVASTTPVSFWETSFKQHNFNTVYNKNIIGLGYNLYTK